MGLPAVALGVIGVSIDLLYLNYANTSYEEYSSDCKWQHAGWWIICYPQTCPDGYIPFRNQTENSNNEYNYGTPCIYGSKKFCCGKYNGDDTWQGSYVNAWDGSLIKCKYFGQKVPENGDCGRLKCSLTVYNPTIKSLQFHEKSTSLITGPECDRVKLFSYYGVAEPGRIDFYTENGAKHTGVWIKTGVHKM
ncbi:hypothetical protein Ddc_17608 [Ditylenchus destructor]|nr:hypothetical protein Ddc_17608 [Ditylenchus destructor]